MYVAEGYCKMLHWNMSWYVFDSASQFATWNWVFVLRFDLQHLNTLVMGMALVCTARLRGLVCFDTMYVTMPKKIWLWWCKSSPHPSRTLHVSFETSTRTATLYNKTLHQTLNIGTAYWFLRSVHQRSLAGNIGRSNVNKSILTSDHVSGHKLALACANLMPEESFTSLL